MVEQDGSGIVSLLMVVGFFGWIVVAVPFFRDPRIGSGSPFVQPLERFRDVPLMELVFRSGGEIPLGR